MFFDEFINSSQKEKHLTMNIKLTLLQCKAINLYKTLTYFDDIQLSYIKFHIINYKDNMHVSFIIDK